MGQLLVKELERLIINALKIRAAEGRANLEQALLQPNRRSFIDILMDIPDVGNDSDFIKIHDQDTADEQHVHDLIHLISSTTT